MPVLSSHRLEPRPVQHGSLAARRLEDVSDVLLLFAYGLGFLALALGAGPALIASGIGVEWRFLSALGGLLAAAVVFILLKYAAEATRSLADVARAAARLEAQLDALSREPDAPGQAPSARKAG